MEASSRRQGVLTLLVPQVIECIMDECGYGEDEATELFLGSQVYAALEDRETGVWHFSPKTLSMMFAEEQATGAVTFPEGA